MLTCYDVANYFIWLANTLSGSITNMKLQKLVYYAQGYHLALYDEPLFAEQIRAWDHGPVAPPLYREYSAYGSEAIPSPEGFDVSAYSEREILLLDGVYARLGHFSAWQLREMTHREDPWKEFHPQGVITQDAMKVYFKKRVDSDNQLELLGTPIVARSSKVQPKVETSNSPQIESDVRKSRGFQAYLASKKKRFEVYRRLAES